MPYLPLQLPPGVQRNGTKYQAKNRWYAADLVRWQEGAMQPIGGWTRLSRSDSPDLDAAISDDGGVFTDETTDANSAAAADVTLSPAVPAENDAFYVGSSYEFGGVIVNISTAQVGGTVVWEYYNGTTWVDLSVAHNLTDNSSGFTAGTATYNVTFDEPTDWATTTVNSQGPFYYVRARQTAAATSGATGTAVDLYPSALKLLEEVRGMIGWRDNAQDPNMAFGTPTKLYHFSLGALTDITPTTFTTASAVATLSSGNYGDGPYGQGLYGYGDTSLVQLTEAQSWQLDNFGEDLVAFAKSDGKIYYWDTSVGGVAAPVTDATATDPPENCTGMVVTPERFVVALGADGDGRYIRWSDQEDANDWTLDLGVNQAGDFTLPGAGELQCGARNRNETLLWTDVDLFSMRYIGGTLVYSFNQVGANCGIISRRAFATVDGRVFWMGQRGFFTYDGFAKPVPCSISDDVFNNLNRTQRSLVWAQPMSEYREVWFFYPSEGSEECDRVAVYNYAENHWSGPWTLQRSAGFDRGAYDFAVMADELGQFYYMENGTSYLKPNRASSYNPSAESGPFEIGSGDQVMSILRVIPDETTLGEVDITLYAGLYPTASEDSQSITTLTEPTSSRLTGRQVRLKVEQDSASSGWRVGTFRLEVRPRGRR